ncbi:hypothetical protein VTK26DRAFT_2471 [Humicola hyalothermophila]
MPRIRLPKREEDPFRRINNWDDGYWYLKRGSHASSPNREYEDHSSPLPPRRPAVTSPSRDAREERRTHNRGPPNRHRYPSPQSDPDRYHAGGRRRAPPAAREQDARPSRRDPPGTRPRPSPRPARPPAGPRNPRDGPTTANRQF